MELDTIKDLMNFCVTTRFENSDTSHPYIQIVVNTPEMDSYFGIRMNMPLIAG
jgi:hypothetical protein